MWELKLICGCRRSTAVKDGISLASMDIFAGCGGLTEGLHQVRGIRISCLKRDDSRSPKIKEGLCLLAQAKAAHAKWAIEYEDAAAEAFRLNHPEATCWAKNCNVILTAAMQKAGMTDLCAGSPEVSSESLESSRSLKQWRKLNLTISPYPLNQICHKQPFQRAWTFY